MLTRLHQVTRDDDDVATSITATLVCKHENLAFEADSIVKEGSLVLE